ncbi:MAG: metallophosphoesterase [Anaerolineae bacterium]
MRVLAVSDQIVEALYSPALGEIARGVDLVLSAGDLPSGYLEYIVSTLDVPLYYVMGNHGGMGGEKPYPEGCENIDGRVVTYRGVLLAGLEGSIRYNESSQFQYTEGEMRWKIARLTPRLMMNRLQYGRYLDICLTHAPPFGIQDGSDRAHHGFRAFLPLIDRYRPSYLIHGHQHVYDRRTVTQTIRGRTLVVNTFGYKLIDIPDGTIRSTNRS